MKFIVRTRKKDGGEEESVREGIDRFEVAHALRGEGTAVLSVSPAKESFLHAVVSNFLSGTFTGHVSLHEKVVFAKNLSAMISAGLSLSRALSVLLRQSTNARLKKVIGEIREGIDKGSSFNEALKLYPTIFSDVFVAMVAAGEESGTLPQSLNIVGEQLDKSYSLRKKVSGALMYPGVILAAMSVIGIFMIIYVVPTLSASFADLGAELPTSTKIIITTSNFVAQYPLYCGLALVAVILACVYILRTESGRRILHRASLRIPGVSSLVRQTNTATIARTVSSLVSAGVDLVEAITITKRVVPNSQYKESLEHAKIAVQKGLPLSGVFAADLHLYPVLLGAMAEVGEETGMLPEMLMNTALFYEEEVDTATKSLETIIEPVLMLLIGVVVGVFAVSMIAPIYSLSSAF